MEMIEIEISLSKVYESEVRADFLFNWMFDRICNIITFVGFEIGIVIFFVFIIIRPYCIHFHLVSNFYLDTSINYSLFCNFCQKINEIYTHQFVKHNYCVHRNYHTLISFGSWLHYDISALINKFSKNGRREGFIGFI